MASCKLCRGKRTISRKAILIKSYRSIIFVSCGVLKEDRKPELISIGGMDACPRCTESCEITYQVDKKWRKPVTDFSAIEEFMC